MAKYRKKPVVIEAVPVSEVISKIEESDPGIREELPAWVHEAFGGRGDELPLGRFWLVRGAIEIRTLEGCMIGVSGDMLIRGVSGELYPCKSDIFEKTYEPVEE